MIRKYFIETTIKVRDEGGDVGIETDIYDMEDTIGDGPPAIHLARMLVDKSFGLCLAIFDENDDTSETQRIRDEMLTTRKAAAE